MGLVQSKWRDEMCRVEDGIFFANDEFVPLEGEPSSGFTAAPRGSIHELLANRPDGWTKCWELVDVACDDNCRILAGETAWEAEGFVALIDSQTKSLMWIIHLHSSEPVKEVQLSDGIIRAVSAEYPFRFEWRIPIDAPEQFTIRAIGDELS